MLNDAFVDALVMPRPLFPALGGYCCGILCRAGVPMKISVVNIFLKFSNDSF